MWAAKRIQLETTDLKTNKVTPREILVDADRLRMNDGDTSVMFLTKGGNRLVMLNKARNEYQEIDQATMDAMSQQMAGMMAQMEAMMKNMPPAQRAQMEQMMKGKMGAVVPAAPAAKTVYAAKGAGNANGFSCTNYDGMRGAEKVSALCAAQPGAIKISASDFQVMEKMREFMAGMMSALQNSPLAGMMSGGGVTQEGINGFPVQTTTFENGQAVRREDLKAVADVTLTDADFSTGNAKKTEMPGMGGRGK